MSMRKSIREQIKRIPGSVRIYRALRPQAPNNNQARTDFLNMKEAILHETLTSIEAQITDSTSQDELYEKLRPLGLTNFGFVMLSMPDPGFPKISGVLPGMASEQTQMQWTGAAGIPLLIQTIDFVRSVAFNFHRFTGESLENKTVLDFGCGYGRIARLMYFLTTTDNFFAVDPMNGSIEECAAHGLTKNFLLSNWSATDLPTGQRKFSLIFSFSVFTHLSETAARIALTTLLRHLEPNGLLVISIRPVEYWYFDKYTNDRKLSDHQVAAHNREGFSFLPHGQEQGIPNYGEASMTPAWIESSFPGVEVLGLDRSISDPCQIYVFMRNTDSAG